MKYVNSKKDPSKTFMVEECFECMRVPVFKSKNTGKGSGGVFLTCPPCGIETKLKKTEDEAVEDWNNYETVYSTEGPPIEL